MKKEDIKNALKNGNMINFYEIPDMKEYKSNIDDREYKRMTGFSISDHILLCGKTGSGKSNILLNFLYICQNMLSKPFFTKIYMLVKKKEPITEFIKTKLGEDYCEIHYDIGSFPAVETFQDMSKKNKDKFLIVIDDYVNDKRGIADKKIMDYMTFSRGKNCVVMFLTQSYFDTKIFIRKNVSWVLLAGISGENDLKRILSDYKGKNTSLETLHNMYKFCKDVEKGEPSFLKIYTQQCNENERFFKNFIIPLDPKYFKDLQQYDDENY